MELLNEMKKEKKISMSNITPIAKYKVFEDNIGTLEISMNRTYIPMTKHINDKLHHFRYYVNRNEIVILLIKTEGQFTDYLAKTVHTHILQNLRKLVIGW